MKRLVLQFGVIASRHCRWGNERGIALFGVTVIVSALAVAASLLFFSSQKKQGKNPLSGGAQDQATLTTCVQSSQNHLAILREQFPAGNIPADNQDLQALAMCAQQVSAILQNNAGATPDPQWQQALTDLGALIASKDSCTFDIAPTEAPAGTASPPINLTVTAPATVVAPQEGGGDVVAIVTAQSGETAQLRRTTGLRFEGKITLDGTNATPFGGTSLTVSLSLNGSLLATQCPAKFFTWLEPVTPKGSLTAPATATSGAAFTLTANVFNADNVTVTGDNGSSYQQTCNPKHVCNFLQPGVTITQKTVFTLTATQGGKQFTLDTKTVNVGGKYTLTLSSSVPGANAVTSNSATVEGTVTPPPPAGTTLTVNLGVGSSLGVFATVDSGGSFVAVVPLVNKVTASDVILLTTGLDVTSCGTVSTVILLEDLKSQSERANDITGVVIDRQTNASASNVATLTIYHTVEVNSVSVDWSGTCPGPHTDFPGGLLEPSGVPLEVGRVNCGTPCPGHGTDCTATLTVTVATSVGPLTGSGQWTVKIP